MSSDGWQKEYFFFNLAAHQSTGEGSSFPETDWFGPKSFRRPLTFPNKCFEWVRYMHFYLRSLMAHCHHLKKSHFCISARICFQKKRWGMVWTWNIDTTYHTFMKIWSTQVVAVWRCPVSLSAFSLDFAAQHRAMLRLTLKLICPR